MSGNDPTCLLFLAFEKYGIDNFLYEELDVATAESEAKRKEIQWIQESDSFRRGYNRTKGGEGTYGLVGEKATNAKISEETAKSIIEDSCSHAKAAKLYTTSVNNVMAIRNGRSWEHLNRTKAPAYNNPNFKITEKEARLILSDKRTHQEVAQEYGLTIGIVRDVRLGNSWRNIPRKDISYKRKNCKINEEIASMIISDSCSGKEASGKYGLSASTISEVRNGKRWKDLDRSNAPKYKDNRGRKSKCALS